MTIGHADRFGSDKYNQRLSEQRVATVKAYMVSKGVESGRIYTEGKGETQPVTKAGDCTGPKSAKVIACLQPDRRVDIEVIGTKIVR
jgi:OOP family OmpA-OmpF porin